MFIIHDLKNAKIKKKSEKKQNPQPRDNQYQKYVVFLSYFFMNILFIDMQSDAFVLYMF